MNIRRHLFTEKINGKTYKVGGIPTKKQHKEDPRDFVLGWGFLKPYKPKHERLVFDTFSVKDQQSMNTCTQESATIQKELAEQQELSEQSLTCLAKEAGYISGDGFSNLTKIQKAVKWFGIARKTLLAGTRSWPSYSSAANLTKAVRDDAKKQRSQSFWKVSGRDARLKALDDGHILYNQKEGSMTTGMDWYSGFNQSGGFAAPWIISSNVGWLAGGHAVIIIGYDLDYHGKKVYVLQNSYGKRWGDDGKFYVEMDFFDRHGHATYAQKDIAVDIGKFISSYEGKQVKAIGVPEIFLISHGKKHSFVDPAIFRLHGGQTGFNRSYEFVEKEMLDQVPRGEDVKPEDSPVWDIIKGVWPQIKVLNEMEYWSKLEPLLETYGKTWRATTYFKSLKK